MANFIRDIIDADLAAGRHTSVVTRFPPEPNGYLHIGHAKSICLNFGLARDYRGRCHLRFDDTNPVTEDTEYVESIAADVRWLGFDWGEHLYYASDYFERMYGFAVELIRAGLAYVDDQDQEAMRANRGTVTVPGTPSPWRDRTVDENLDLFARMRAGEFPEGSRVLRARIDMSSPNMLMRDPLLYRIRHAHHHRTGDAWCIYPMYDFAHCIEDAIEGVTHSICTLEFENNRELYDWILEHISAPARPRQYEFARLNLDYTVMSKRKLLLLVQDGHVEGWDDPRMPTIAGLRRRGVTPEAIRQFADMIGVARSNSVVDLGKLEFCVRDDLNHRAPRALAVLRPLRVTLTNLADDERIELDASLWPHDVPHEGSRPLSLGRSLLIEQDDFALDPPRGFKRLAPGRTVRLRHGVCITCDDVVTDDTGAVTELRCTAHRETLNADAPDGMRVHAVIHWVCATTGVPARVRLYDRLFSVPNPEADDERPFTAFLNPASLVEVDAVVEPWLATQPAGGRYQFERLGYFYADPTTSADGAPVFNRIVTLRDSWTRGHNTAVDASARRSTTPPSTASPSVASPSVASPSAAPPSDTQPAAPPTPGPGAAVQAGGASGATRHGGGETDRDRARSADPALASRYEALRTSGVVGDDEAELLAASHTALDTFEAMTAAGASGASAARWLTQDVPREARERGLDGVDLTPAGVGPLELAALACRVDDGTVTTTAAREILAALLDAREATPAPDGDAAAARVDAVIDARGLRAIRDDGALDALIADVLARHPAEVARFREGKVSLLGFFVGQVVRASGGAADAGAVRERLARQLGA